MDAQIHRKESKKQTLKRGKEMKWKIFFGKSPYNPPKNKAHFYVFECCRCVVRTVISVLCVCVYVSLPILC